MGECVDPDSRVATLEQPKSGGGSLRSSSLSGRWTTAFLLTPPLLWFLVLYVSSLVLMLVASFWSINSFTGNLTHQPHRKQLLADHVGLVPRDHPAHGDPGGAGDRYRRDHRLSLRLRHGARGESTGSTPLAGGRALAAVGELPGEDLRLGLHTAKGRHAQLDLSALGPARAEHRLLQRRDVGHLLLHLAALHDRAALWRVGEDPLVAPRRLERPRGVRAGGRCAT